MINKMKIPIVEGKEPQGIEFDEAHPLAKVSIRLVLRQCLTCGTKIDADSNRLLCWKCEEN